MCGSKKWRALIANDADISEFDDELYFMKRKIEDDANQDASNEVGTMTDKLLYAFGSLSFLS